jgi:hypothetical protein
MIVPNNRTVKKEMPKQYFDGAFTFVISSQIV